MKKRKLVLLTTLSLLTNLALVHAEGHEGHGGGAIVCADGDGKIISAKLLDLRKAEKDGFEIARSDKPKDDQLEDAFLKLSSSYDNDLATQMKDILKVVKIVSSTKRLPPPTDTKITELNEPRNCSLEGVASYDDATNTITVDPEIIAAMSQTDIAALYFHEALYKAERDNLSKANDSVQARELTGAIFSTAPLKLVPVYEGVENAPYVCESSDHELQFYIFESQNEEIKVQFTRIPNLKLVERTYAEYNPKAGIYPMLKKGLMKSEREILDTDPPVLQKIAKQSKLSRWFNGPVSYWGKTYGDDQFILAHSKYAPSYHIELESVSDADTYTNWVTETPHYFENKELRFRLVDVYGNQVSVKEYRKFTCEKQ